MSDSGHHNYYRPYNSDNESDSGSESDSRRSSKSSDSESWFYKENQIKTDSGPNFHNLAVNLNKEPESILSETSTLTKSVSELYKNIGNSLLPDSIKNDKSIPNTVFDSKMTNNVSILTVDSLNRDKKVYVQPTYCVLRFPKLYKNIISITFAEIKLLTSIYFFNKTKGNTDITIYEKDRFTLDENNKLQSTIIKTYINDGSYNVTDLLTNIQNQLNKVPLFYDFINGFDDFNIQFTAMHDLSIVFNKPGDFFYDSDSGLFIDNPTLDTITSHFWISRYTTLDTYTIDTNLVAYYYPVLKYYYMNKLSGEINLLAGIGIDPSITTTSDVYNKIMFTFQGLIDPIVTAVIKASLTFLDKYRLHNTFRNSLVNKYIVTINSQTQRISFSSAGLNTSLSNLISFQQTTYLNKALSNINKNLGEYNDDIASSDRLLAVVDDMFRFYQTQFLTYFSVPWNQYTISYYMNLSNTILLRNGQSIENVSRNTLETISSGIITYSNDINIKQSNVSYWPTFSNVENTIAFTNLSNATSSFNYVYSQRTNSINSNINFINPNKSLYSQFLTDSSTVVCPITAGKYTVIKFINPVRQTIEIETLPRPIAYRLPLYNNSNYNSNINKYFNMPYIFTSNISYTPLNNYTTIYDTVTSNTIINIPGWSNNSSWGLSFTSSLSYYSNASRINITNVNGSLYYKFITPSNPEPLLNSSFTYLLNLSFSFYDTIDNLSTVISPPNDYTAFIYHDRGAFMGDMNGSKTRNENPYFYKYSLKIKETTQSNTIQFRTYPNQTYYISVRPDKVSAFPLCFITAVPWFSSNYDLITQSLSIEGLNPKNDIYLDSFSTLVNKNFNYAQVYDSNWIQLPITSSLLNKYVDNNKLLITSNLRLGYDINGVSTDYLDYIPYNINSDTQAFNPSYNLGIDPINKYLFQSNSAYSQGYFYNGTENIVMTPGIQIEYIPGQVNRQQYKIVHYYSVTYLPESELTKIYFKEKYITNTTAQLPYTLDTTNGVPIPGYVYDGNNSSIQLDRGVIGFSFIPEKGVWDLKKFMFRSAISDSDNDPNNSISYVGIYLLSDVFDVDSSKIYLSNAIVVLSNSKNVTYTSNFTQLNNGFDTKGGTYYEFIKDTSFSNNNLLGYSQTPTTMVNQPESIYVGITFTNTGIINTIKALSGSSIPYPYYNNVFASTVYLDGTKSYISTKGVVFPSTIGQTQWPTELENIDIYSPKGDPTQSQYANSIPIGTSVVLYKKYTNVLENTNFLKKWDIITKPITINAHVPGFMLIHTTQIIIYKYSQYDVTYNFNNIAWEFTIDSIFSLLDFTSLVAITGNDYFYFFLGLKTINSVSTLRIKKFNPLTGEIMEVSLPSFSVPSIGVVKSFTINNLNQLVIIYLDKTNRTYFYYTKTDFTSANISSATIPLLSTATHTMDADSSTLFWLQQDLRNNLGNNIYEWNISSNFPGTLLKCTDSSLYWNEIAITSYIDIPDVKNRLFLTNTISTTTISTNAIYYTDKWLENTFNLSIINKSSFSIQHIYSGFSGSLWVTDKDNLVIWGNRNQQIDIPGNITPAWQIFYPFQKITLEKVDSNYNPITDLTNINYPEYPHTKIFYYDKEIDYNNDILTSWGLEKNFTKTDTLFNGNYFNSYIEKFSIDKSVNNSDYKFIVIRGFTPTENSEVLLRFVIPNKYTFGYINNINLINEISNNNISFDINYTYTLSNFNNNFNQTSRFGGISIPNYNGRQIITTSYSDYYIQLSTLYSEYVTINNNQKYVNAFVNSNITLFISTQLVNILPPSILKSQTFTSPLIFTILWNSSLLPQYKDLTDNWGLGYNLGFKKMDTPFSIYHVSLSFYKILEDYLYLRLSPEYSINTLDITTTEDLSITRESRGSIKEYYGKLLLGDFNTYSRTFVSNQVTFNPPIAKLDKLSFEWLTSSGVRLDNTDCEWSASLAITEYINTQTSESSIIIQKVPVSSE